MEQTLTVFVLEVGLHIAVAARSNRVGSGKRFRFLDLLEYLPNSSSKIVSTHCLHMAM